MTKLFLFKDINKYFDRVYELNYSDLSSNEGFSHEILVEPKKANFTAYSPEIKIINTVIQTREVKLNSIELYII
jgi:hypothetical protein